MDRYIHEQNLLHYRKVLAEATDQIKRRTVLRLLADEQAKVFPQALQLCSDRFTVPQTPSR